MSYSLEYTVHGSILKYSSGQILSLLEGLFPTQVSCIGGRFFTEPLGKPKNTGLGSLFLLQQIFLTQDSNWGLLHYRQILYQLSYRGSHSYQSVGSILCVV